MTHSFQVSACIVTAGQQQTNYSEFCSKPAFDSELGTEDLQKLRANLNRLEKLKAGRLKCNTIRDMLSL